MLPSICTHLTETLTPRPTLSRRRPVSGTAATPTDPTRYPRTRPLRSSGTRSIYIARSGLQTRSVGRCRNGIKPNGKCTLPWKDSATRPLRMLLGKPRRHAAVRAGGHSLVAGWLGWPRLYVLITLIAVHLTPSTVVRKKRAR